MIRRLFTTLLFVLLTAGVAHATTISASGVADSFTHPLASAKLCFAPVDATGTATGFRVGSLQVVSTPVCGLVSNGVLQSGLSVAPNPTGIYYRITAQNRTTSVIIRDYGMTQITGSSWTLDSYDPTSMAVVPVSTITMGTVTTLAPGTGAYCTISGSSPYLLNCGVPQGATGATGSGTLDSVARSAAAAAQTTASAALPIAGGGMSGPLSLSAAYISSLSNTNQAATAQNVRNAASISVKEFGAVGDGTTDDTTALNAALTYELANGGCLYFPAGIYKYKSQLVWNSGQTLCMKGVSQKSFLYYAGTASIGGAFYAHYSTGWTQVDVRDLGFLANSNAAYAFQGLQVGGISTMDTVMFLGGNTSSFEGDFWNAEGDLRNLSVGQTTYLASGLNLGCVNGLTFARGLNFPSLTDYYASGQFTLTMPTVEGCSGTGLNISAAQGVTVNGGQLSGNHQNILDATNATAGTNFTGNIYNGVLSESGTVADQIKLPSHFEGALFSNAVQTYNSVTFNGTQLAGTLTAETGTFGPSITNSYFGTLVDNSLDGIQKSNNINAWGQKVPEQRSSYALNAGGACVTTSSHYTYQFNNTGNGTYVIGTVPYTGAGGAWEAWVKGAFYDTPASSPGIASDTELTQVNPTITFTDAGTLTLAVSSSGLSATLAGIGGYGVSGVIEVDFYPGTNCGYQQPSYSMTTHRPINAVGGIIVGTGGNTVYRCLTAGTLPIGALTTVTADCGTSTDTGLKTQ